MLIVLFQPNSDHSWYFLSDGLRIIKSRKEKCMSTKKKPSPESIVREIKRKTRRKFSAEEKIRIVLEGLRGEQSITDLCRREGPHHPPYVDNRRNNLLPNA